MFVYSYLKITSLFLKKLLFLFVFPCNIILRRYKILLQGGLLMSTQFNGASNPYARNLTIVKGFFRKPIVLVFALLSFIMFILNIINTTQSSETLKEFYNTYGANFSGDTVSNMSGSNAGNIIALIVSGIAVLCYFMIYFMSKNSNPKISPAPFFTVLHVFSVIELVAVAIATLLTVIATVLLAIAGFSGSDDSVFGTATYYKTTIIISLIIFIAIFLILFFFFNSQTAFLKSCKRSCSEPMIQKKGANTYGTFCLIVAVLYLVGIVIALLVLNSISDIIGNEFTELTSLLEVSTLSIVSSILIPVNYIIRGIIAKNYDKYATENAEYAYAYAASAAATRSPEANPIATFNAGTRSSRDAVQQPQPYLYGEEEDTSANKKSQYIPKELQEDYPQQQFDPQQNPYGVPMQFDPQFSQPDPYGGMQQDPFMQPTMGNPYSQPIQDPNSQNPYNNGMM